MDKAFDENSGKIEQLVTYNYVDSSYENSLEKIIETKNYFRKSQKNHIVLLFREIIDEEEIENLKNQIQKSTKQLYYFIIVTSSEIEKSIKSSRKVRIIILNTNQKKMTWPKSGKKEAVLNARLAFLLSYEIQSEADKENWLKEFSHYFDVVAVVMSDEL